MMVLNVVKSAENVKNVPHVDLFFGKCDKIEKNREKIKNED